MGHLNNTVTNLNRIFKQMQQNVETKPRYSLLTWFVESFFSFCLKIVRKINGEVEKDCNHNCTE